jgi:hypothetical protein
LTCRNGGAAGDGIEGYRLRHHKRITADLAPTEIETLRQERTLSHEQQPPRSQVGCLRVGRYYAGTLPGVERTDINAANIAGACDEEEEVFAVWKELRIPVSY